MRIPFYLSLVFAIAILLITVNPITRSTSAIYDAKRSFLRVEAISQQLVPAADGVDLTTALEKLVSDLEQVRLSDRRSGKIHLWQFAIGLVLVGALISQALMIRALRRGSSGGE